MGGNDAPVLAVNFIVHGDFSHIGAALRSLYETTTIPMMVYVTINTGDAPEIAQIRDQYPNVTIIINPKPAGFAANHNAILRLAEADYVALINDDVTFHPKALDTLVNYLHSHDDVGLVGPLVEKPNGQTQVSAYSDPTLPRMLFHISGLGSFTKQGGIVRRSLQKIGFTRLFGAESLRNDLTIRDVPVIVGVCMVVRRKAYLQAGLMDEYTIVNGEEFGWHWRIRQKGWRVILIPTARIVHYNPGQDISGWKLAEHRKGILSYFTAYRPRWQAAIIRLSIIFFNFWAAVFWFPFNRENAHSHWQTMAMGLYFHLPQSH